MAIITSNATGDWGTGGTWVGGVAPADNDSVVIAAGHVVTFNVDQSGFANGIAGITVTGTLSLTRTAGTYYMKIKAAATINGAGAFDCGTLASPIPFTAKHTITGGAGWYINGAAGLTMTVYAAEPAIKYALLSNNEAIGATRIEIDTDVTGDIWGVGDTIHITDLSAAYSEVKVIGAIAAGYIDVTVALTAVKPIGNYLVLVTRNVRIVGAAGGYLYVNFASGKLTIAGGESTTSYVGNGDIFGVCNGVTITGGSFSNGYGYSSLKTNFNVSGGVFSHYKYGGLVLTSSIISGGLFVGNINGIALTSSLVTGGVFSRNSGNLQVNGCLIAGGASTYGMGGLTGNAVIKNFIMSNNNYDLYSFYGSLYNTLLGSSTEYSAYTSNGEGTYVESIDHDQVAGAFRAWTKGGITTRQAVVFPVGFTYAMQTVLESASYKGYWQKEVAVGAGASVQITYHLRKDASMTYLPRIITFNKASADPFAGGAGLDTFTMTDSVDTWESDSYTYTNSGTEDVTLVIRTQGMNAANNLYSYIDVEVINVDLTSALAELAAIRAKTDNLPIDPADESSLEGVIGIVDTVVDAIKAKTDQLAFTVANQVDANTLTGGISAAQVNAEMVDVLRTDLIPDSYAADGAQPTFAQAILAIQQFLMEKAVSGTTVTVKKPDGTTQALTLTLDNESSPTSISRAT